MSKDTRKESMACFQRTAHGPIWPPQWVQRKQLKMKLNEQIQSARDQKFLVALGLMYFHRYYGYSKVATCY